jgi:hypothetical protein
MRGAPQRNAMWELQVGKFGRNHRHLRKRLPVAANTAFMAAGAVGSPMPPGAAVLLKMCTSIAVASFMRSTGKYRSSIDLHARPLD